MRLLHEITPMILTFNEEANIGRTLAKLAWAKRILLIDSGSTDRTLEIAKQYLQVEVIRRNFDTAAPQCNFGLTHVESEWVLSLDADYVLSDELIAELAELRPGSNVRGFWARFVFQIFGRSLRASLYPPRAVLYRKSSASYLDEGHTQRVRIDGQLSALPIRSIMTTANQSPVGLTRRLIMRARGELSAKAGKINLGWSTAFGLIWCRRPSWCLSTSSLIKRCLFDGWPGWYYTLQGCVPNDAVNRVVDRRLRSAAQP